MQLARDLLDKQVLDREARKMGKVDDVVLVVRRGKPPRVAAIELGLPTLLDRLHAGLGEWGRRLERRWEVSDGAPVRIPIDRIQKAGINVQADVDADDIGASAWERWVGGVLIGRIPGNGRGARERDKK